MSFALLFILLKKLSLKTRKTDVVTFGFLSVTAKRPSKAGVKGACVGEQGPRVSVVVLSS